MVALEDKSMGHKNIRCHLLGTMNVHAICDLRYTKLLHILDLSLARGDVKSPWGFLLEALQHYTQLGLTLIAVSLVR